MSETRLNKEFSEISPIVTKYEEYIQLDETLKEARELLSSDDKDMVELAEEEIAAAASKPELIEQDLKLMLLPKDTADDGSAFLEIRAGAGGDEAAIFAGDLYRMYSRLSEREGWALEEINIRVAEQGGLKEVIAKLEGKGVFKVLKFESGVHRVQRVPETESQGRVHTSTCTVAILPEVEEVQDIHIDKNDLRVDVTSTTTATLTPSSVAHSNRLFTIATTEDVLKTSPTNSATWEDSTSWSQLPQPTSIETASSTSTSPPTLPALTSTPRGWTITSHLPIKRISINSPKAHTLISMMEVPQISS